MALLQQLRGVESERSFLRDAQRFFAHLFPGIVGLWPSSLHRRIRNLRRFLEPLRRAVLVDLAGDPETLVVDSTLLAVLHPRQIQQSAGFDGAAWAVWSSFAVYGVKLHLLCSTNRVPLSYELTAANVADVLLVRELLRGADLDEGGGVRRLFGDLAYRSGPLGEELAEAGVLLQTERADRRPAIRQQVEVCFAALKRVFGMGETLAATLVGLVTRIAAKVCAYTYALYVNRLLGRPQGRIKELWDLTSSQHSSRWREDCFLQRESGECEAMKHMDGFVAGNVGRGSANSGTLVVADKGKLSSSQLTSQKVGSRAKVGYDSITQTATLDPYASTTARLARCK